MSERQLVRNPGRRQNQDRSLAAGLQRTASAQFVGLPNAAGVCGNSSIEAGARISRWLGGERGFQRHPLTPHPHPRSTRVYNERTSQVMTGRNNGGRSIVPGVLTGLSL